MRNFKLFSILSLLLTLTGCGAVDRFFASVTGDGTPTCWKGVTYVQFTSGASVAYNPDGSIMKCS